MFGVKIQNVNADNTHGSKLARVTKFLPYSVTYVKKSVISSVITLFCPFLPKGGILESYYEKAEVKNHQINQRMMVCGVLQNYLCISVIQMKA